MTENPTSYVVDFVPQFYKDLKALSDKKIQEKLLQAAEDLDVVPGKQGFPLFRELKGLRSLHFSRYRIIYRVQEDVRAVLVITVGRRKDADANDIYALLKKLHL